MKEAVLEIISAKLLKVNSETDSDWEITYSIDGNEAKAEVKNYKIEVERELLPALDVSDELHDIFRQYDIHSVQVPFIKKSYKLICSLTSAE